MHLQVGLDIHQRGKNNFIKTTDLMKSENTLTNVKWN